MQDPASLDRLHDIVMPPVVSWWPPAPGWYLAALILVTAILVLVRRFLRLRHQDAYRRAALRELEELREARAIAELLRRTALTREPRELIANLSGRAWSDWLAARCPGTMPTAVREILEDGIYRGAMKTAALGQLRDYARVWIEGHRAGRGVA